MIKIFCDGSAAPNPGPGGAAMVVIDDDEGIVYAWSIYEDHTTNNRMEMKALIKALEYARSEELFAVPIYSDSSYVVNLYNDWMHKWVKANWTRKNSAPVENLDLVKELYDLFFLCSCEVIKVKGHNGVYGNEVCDALASKNAQKLEILLKAEDVFKSYEIMEGYYKNLEKYAIIYERKDDE